MMMKMRNAHDLSFDISIALFSTLDFFFLCCFFFFQYTFLCYWGTSISVETEIISVVFTNLVCVNNLTILMGS